MDRKAADDQREPIKNASPEVQKIIFRVLEAERDKLYKDKPNLISDIVDIIKAEVT
jgi:hypothetical protein